jgi:serine protease Do
MKLHVVFPVRRIALAITLALGVLGLVPVAWSAAPPTAPEIPSIFSKPLPQNAEELRAIQEQVKAVVKKVMPATVGIQIGPGAGSGVIISADGFVLTAGHVSGEPNQNCIVILQDGRRVKGKTLGYNQGMDSGLIKITEPGPWPHVNMGRSNEVKVGQWCLGLGHPGGFRPGRTPVVRLGQVLSVNNRLIQTSCKLVGGDSGGPLFDMAGRVIGIHSRIGQDINANIHVPVNSFREDWERLARGDKWGGLFDFSGGRRPAPAYMGVVFEPGQDNLKIVEVPEGTPAAQAGVMPGDVITAIDGKAMSTREELLKFMQTKKPGEAIKLQVRRGEQVLTFDLKLVRRPTE